MVQAIFHIFFFTHLTIKVLLLTCLYNNIDLLLITFIIQRKDNFLPRFKPKMYLTFVYTYLSSTKVATLMYIHTNGIRLNVLRCIKKEEKYSTLMHQEISIIQPLTLTSISVHLSSFVDLRRKVIFVA